MGNTNNTNKTSSFESGKIHVNAIGGLANYYPWYPTYDNINNNDIIEYGRKFCDEHGINRYDDYVYIGDLKRRVNDRIYSDVEHHYLKK